MPRILWMSPYSLHDTSSGASVDAKNMLESLVNHGYEVWSCASFVFDRPNGAGFFGDLSQLLDSHSAKVFNLEDHGIKYTYVRCQNTYEQLFSMEESQLFYEVYLEILDRFNPDIVLGYCPGMISLACFSEAQRRGMKTVYLLVNGNHGHFSFNFFDLVITDSHATSQLYAERDHINVVPTGAFFNPQRIVATTSQSVSWAKGSSNFR